MVDARRRLSDRGALVFIDISAEEKPPADDPGPSEEQPQKKMQFTDPEGNELPNLDEIIAEHEQGQEGEINEESTLQPTEDVDVASD